MPNTKTLFGLSFASEQDATKFSDIIKDPGSEDWEKGSAFIEAIEPKKSPPSTTAAQTNFQVQQDITKKVQNLKLSKQEIEILKQSGIKRSELKVDEHLQSIVIQVLTESVIKQQKQRKMSVDLYSTGQR